MTSTTWTKPKAPGGDAGPPPGRDPARPWPEPATAAAARRVKPQLQVDPAALELELVDLALAVILAAGLEREQFTIAG
jgi:hypothetical protein